LVAVLSRRPRKGRRLLREAPRYDELYGLLGAAGRNAERATGLVAELIRDWPEGSERRHDLVTVEHEGDAITAKIVRHLHTRAVTPFERSDLLSLASQVDDIVDFAEEAADLLALYGVEAPMEQGVALGEVLQAAGREVCAALSSLDRPDLVHGHVVATKRLEEDGDRVARGALASLFEGGIDPMVVIRWKDIYDRLEQAIDSCDRAAHVLEGMLLKQA
jgi:predicted phosphate transport protein (TIGR00153 family)